MVRIFRNEYRSQSRIRGAKAMMSNIEKVVSFVWKIACVVFGIPLLLVALDASLRAMESNFSVRRVVRTSWWWGGYCGCVVISNQEKRVENEFSPQCNELY